MFFQKNKKKYYVSFIGTSYKNSELDVIKSLQSCINQNYDFCEFIFVLPPFYNNLRTFRKIKNQDKRIKLIFTKKLETLSKSLNLALGKAEGEYICRIDFDDIHLRNKLKKQIELMRKCDFIDVCGTNALLKIKGKKKKLILPRFHSQIKKSFFLFNPIVHSSVLVRRSFFEKHNGYNSHYKFSEDLELWLKGLSNKSLYHNIQKFLTECNLRNENARVRKNFEYNFKSRKLYSLNIYGFFFGSLNIFFFYIYKSLPQKMKNIIKKLIYKKTI